MSSKKADGESAVKGKPRAKDKEISGEAQGVFTFFKWGLLVVMVAVLGYGSFVVFWKEGTQNDTGQNGNVTSPAATAAATPARMPNSKEDYWQVREKQHAVCGTVNGEPVCGTVEKIPKGCNFRLVSQYDLAVTPTNGKTMTGGAHDHGQGAHNEILSIVPLTGETRDDGTLVAPYTLRIGCGRYRDQV